MQVRAPCEALHVIPTVTPCSCVYCFALPWPAGRLYRPYSTDVTHYVILQFTLLVYQLSAPSSYKSLVNLQLLQLERDKDINLMYCHNPLKMAAAPYTHDGRVRICDLMTSSNKVYI